MSNFQAPQRKKNALDNAALRLYAPNNTGKNASLSVAVRKNGAQITVWTNDPNDTKDNGKISAQLSLPYFQTLLEMLRAAATATAEWKHFIECKGYIFPGGKKSEQPVVTARIVVGRDADGTVYISVTAQGRPNIKFVMTPGGFNSIRNADGSEVSMGFLTSIYALGWASTMQTLLLQLAVIEYEEPAPRQQGGYGNNQRGGGGNGYGNNGGGGNGGGGNNGGSMDDFAGW